MGSPAVQAWFERSGVRAALALLASTAAACNSPDHPPYVLDCSVEQAYDIEVLETYESLSLTGNPTWFSFGDNTPGSGHSGQDGGTLARDIGDGGRCGSQRALVLETYGHNDYGSGFGDYHVGADYSHPVPVDATGYEGISFWARSPPITAGGTTTPSSKSITVSLSDGDSTYVAGWSQCLDYSDAGNTTTVQVVDQNGNFISGGTATNVRPADACGNTFDRTLVMSDRWQFYTLPFSSFTQTADPSRVPTGFDHRLFNFNIRFPKESRGELWLDDLGLYRKATGPKGTKTYADEKCMPMPDDGIVTDFSAWCAEPDGAPTGQTCFGGPNSSGVAGGSFTFGGPGVDDTSNPYCPVLFSQSTFVASVTDHLDEEPGPTTPDAATSSGSAPDGATPDAAPSDAGGADVLDASAQDGSNGADATDEDELESGPVADAAAGNSDAASGNADAPTDGAKAAAPVADAAAGSADATSTEITAVPVTNLPNVGFHLRGKVAGFAGGGVYLAHCLDASQFRGVELTIWSTAGTRSVALQVTQRSNNPPSTGGTCPTEPDGAAPNCSVPSATLPVTDRPMRVRVPWGAFHGGKPTDSIDRPDTIVQLQWQFDWPCDRPIPYDVDVRIADIRFFK